MKLPDSEPCTSVYLACEQNKAKKENKNIL